MKTRLRCLPVAAALVLLAACGSTPTTPDHGRTPSAVGLDAAPSASCDDGMTPEECAERTKNTIGNIR